MSGKRPNLDLFLEVEVKDKSGNILHIHRQKSKSLLKNFAQMLSCMFTAERNAVSTTITNTSGTSQTFFASFFGTNPSYTIGVAPLCMNAPAGNDTHGIQVGSGSTPVSRDDYKLDTKISHGSGSGQLQYGAMTIGIPNGTPPNTVFSVSRTFTNGSGADVTINEIGLVILNCCYNPDYQLGYFLIARDVLSSPQTVGNGYSITVRYIFTITA